MRFVSRSIGGPLDVLTAIPPVSREEFAYQQLKNAIMNGQLAPGESLVQTRIAEQLGISPIPVRSAMNRLAAEGLITQSPHRPPQVSTISPKELEEILAIRTHLEVMATMEAIPHIQPHQMAELERLADQMAQVLLNGTFHEYGALNKEFHLKIYESCPFPLLQQMIKDLWDNSDRYRARTMFSLLPELARKSHEEHLQLLKLIKAGDTDNILPLLQAHQVHHKAFLKLHPGAQP